MRTSPADAEADAAGPRRRPAVVAAVLAMLALYIWLFTPLAALWHLPRPYEAAGALGLSRDLVFDEKQNVVCDLNFFLTGRDNDEDDRLLFFCGIAIAFPGMYYLPRRHKQPLATLTFAALFGAIYGFKTLAGLLFFHLIVYLLLHPVSGRGLWTAALPGALGLLAFTPFPDAARNGAYMLAFAYCGYLAYKYLLTPLLARRRCAATLRTCAVQSAMITTLAGALLHGLTGAVWKLPVTLLLFFWHWERLFMYHLDYEDGQAPPDTPLPVYLSVFFNPAQLCNWNWGVSIGQGYSYVTDSFLRRGHDELALSGLKLWSVALLYLVFAGWTHNRLLAVFEGMGIGVYASVKMMSCHFAAGGQVTAAAVLSTTMIDLCKWFMVWGGVAHFKVGLWRICGYDVAPYFNKPWLATNLVALWSRFTYHYREFLARAFYYPVFFRYFKANRNWRVAVAAMAAAGAGNLLWGHVPEKFFYRGLETGNLQEVLRAWPYFLLLALGIAATELWLLNKRNKTRRPWTLDARLPLDALAAYMTLQFYALIHIFFFRCPEGSVWDHFRLFLTAFGIDAPE